MASRSGSAAGSAHTARRSRHSVFAAWLLASGFRGCSSSYARVDPAHVRDIVARMTLEEKLAELCVPICPEGDWEKGLCDPRWALEMPEAVFDLKSNDRLNIRGFRMRDGPKGLTCRLGGEFGFGTPCPPDGASPSFPSESLRAATWDVALEEEFGAAIGEIARALDLDVALLPSINLLPWLNWGRGQESYGEDPFLSGKMGAASVRGVQSKGVMATAKHFLANNVENNRWYISAEFTEKTLHEVYLKAWAIVVEESAPEMVMTSYNRVLGHWANQNPRFLALLRHRLGFEGSVMTDWWATMETAIASLQSSPFYGKPRGFFGNATTVLTAGVDMEMPFCNFDMKTFRGLSSCNWTDSESCQAANVIDRAVGHLVRSKIRYGLAGVGGAAPRRPPHVPSNLLFAKLRRRFLTGGGPRDAVFDTYKYRELALRIAQRGMVLLRNEGDFLPKRPENVASVVVMGTPEVLQDGDRGSSFVTPLGGTVTVLNGLRMKYGSDRVTHVEALTDETAPIVKGADMVVLDVGLSNLNEGEFIPPSIGGDRKNLTLLPGDLELIAKVAAVNPRIVVAITSGQLVVVEEFVDIVRAIVWMGYPGPMGGQALAGILTGEVNPSGRTTSATPRKAADWVPDGITLEPWTGVEVQYPYSHGFKHMWGAGITPRYPLGWGLSYTRFDHSLPALRSAGAGASAAVTVRVTVSNAGALAGIETVQVYATCPMCRRPRHPIVLVGFARIALEAGASGVAEVAFPAKELAVYDQERQLWFLESGTYSILAGPCADRHRLLSAAYVVEADVHFDYPGAAAAQPDVPGVGASNCDAYRCKKDEDFILHRSAVEGAAFRANMVFLAGMAMVALGALCCGCCCCRCVFRRCRSRCRSDHAKVKQA